MTAPEPKIAMSWIIHKLRRLCRRHRRAVLLARYAERAISDGLHWDERDGLWVDEHGEPWA